MGSEHEDRPSYQHRHDGVLDLGWDGFGHLMKGLVESIARAYSPELVVGIAKGGVLPAVVISSALALDFYPMKLSRRASEMVVRDVPELSVAPPSGVAGKRVLVVDDICVTGTTLELAKAAIAELGATEVRDAAFAIHGESVLPDWYALRTGALILLPWDRNVYFQDRWRINLEYQREIDGMGPGRIFMRIAT